MFEVVRPSNESHEGIKQYYIQKIEELQVEKLNFVFKRHDFLVF